MPSTKGKRTSPSRQTKKIRDHHGDLQIFTIGHATQPILELVSLLREHNVTTLVEIRTIPRSRTNTQHNRDKLEKALPANDNSYIWLGEELGGLRKLDKSLGDLNTGWYNANFRGYADYMQSNEFAAGLQELSQIAKHCCAIMRAETYYRKGWKMRNHIRIIKISPR